MTQVGFAFPGQTRRSFDPGGGDPSGAHILHRQILVGYI